MAYALSTAITDTRRLLKDSTENVWTNSDITYFINQAIDIIKNTIPEYFTSLQRVTSGNIIIDEAYELLIVLYSASKCFEQDEQDYKSSKLLNEFESRRIEMIDTIKESDAYKTILDADSDNKEFVQNEYYESSTAFDG